jgi:GcrA cell cycle regulator
MTEPVWTDLRVERLKALWAEGLSASEIAERLNGVTRNAVLGKLHRLKLLGGRRPQPGACGPKPGRKRVARPVRPHVQIRMAIGLPAETYTPADDALPGEVARLEALGRHQCHWPVGDPKADDFAFCGRWMGAGPYCDAHRRIAYAGKASCGRGGRKVGRIAI